MEKNKNKTNWVNITVWLMICLGIFFGGIVLVGLNYNYLPENTPTAEQSYSYHNYECDGELLNDSCAYAKIVRSGGGVHIKNCKSGNEYFCQSVKEFSND